MPTRGRHGKVLARTALVATVLAVAPLEHRAQDRMSVERRDWQRQSAQALRVHEEQRSQLERARAHARMPSTMYASTPDPAPPHAFPLPAPSMSSVTAAPPRPARSSGALVERAHRIAFFPSASRGSEGGYEGFARLVNHSDAAGEVRIEAFDDEGVAHGPVTLDLGAGESAHFTSEDIEQGNAARGLDGAAGAGEGDWRLEFTSALELEVLAYVRTTDGFLTAMHDRVPLGAGGHRVALFHRGSDANQVSWLRLVNPGAEPAQVRIEGIDDAGTSAPGTVRLEVPAGAARAVSAHALESGGAELSGALGTGEGKWRLVVHSEQALEVMSLLSSPTGHLTNLSTSPANAELDGEAAVHEVAFFPAAVRRAREGLQGFVRIINHSGQAGEVRIEAFDDEGTEAPAVTLDIDASAVVHLTSEDLEQGNADQGLSSGIGAGTGEWRLRLRSTLELEVVAYVQNDDGFLASVHNVVPRTAAGHRVAVLGSDSNADPVSRLRLVNPGARPAQVRIEGIDDRGESPGGAVRLELPAHGARTVTARELESGEGVDGALGDGTGRWRLVVTADQRIEAMSLLSSPAGHLANLSTSTAFESAAKVFRERISEPVVQARCVHCHASGGIAAYSGLRFAPASSANHRLGNLDVFEDFLDAVEDGAALVINKIQGVGHGGGVQVAAGTEEFAHIARFLALLGEDVAPAPITPQTLFDTVQMAPTRKTLRRAALIFAGRIPTDAEYAAAERGPVALRETIRAMMTGPEFHEFLIRGANDRLLTDRDSVIISAGAGHFVDFTNEHHRRRGAARASANKRRWREYHDWLASTQYGFRRAPLELIAHVVENDRPYTEILTADYIMANSWASKAYGAPTRFNDSEDVREFKPSRIVSYYRKDDRYKAEHDPVADARRVLDPGALSTEYPHAGILNTASFLIRYPSTATNRNRARSRWTYYHFLGLDIEKSASRTTDPVALADTNNPTLHNPACTVCHRALDPVAGAFQNYGDEGFYKDQWGGADSLDKFYKRDPPGREDVLVNVRSREEPATVLGTRHLFAGRSNELGLKNLRTFEGDRKLHIGLGEVVVRDDRGHVVQRYETREAATEEDCGSAKDYGYKLWDCKREFLVLPLTVPRDGSYHVEIQAWVLEPGEKAATLQVWMPGPFYRPGDIWYRDMRPPGFAGGFAPNSDNSVQWLARQIVSDERFAESTVKFWWPAIMGSEAAEPPADETDAGFEGLLLAANSQGAEVTRLARGFRHGFQGGRAYNLKDLLVEMVLSRWFRADAVTDGHSIRDVALHDAGARRLLTPEELDRKTYAITGLRLGWQPRINDAHRGTRSKLTDHYRLLYGGIDSDGVTERARDLTSVMAGVAKRHAVQVSCSIVMRELFIAPEANRYLFAGINRWVRPGVELEHSFEVKADSAQNKETLVVSRALTAGSKVVRLSYTNDYRDDSTNANRNLYVDRLNVRNEAGEIVASQELEELGPSGRCNRANGDHYALWCAGWVEFPIDIPADGHTIEVVAWARQAGDELPQLTVAVESNATGSSGETAIRNKLVELYDKLLGVQLTPISRDIDLAFGLYVEVMKLGRASHEDKFNFYHCNSALPLNYFEGIQKNLVVKRENEDGWQWYELHRDRYVDFMHGIDWSDPYHAAQAWVVVLAYLLMDYRYLYL